MPAAEIADMKEMQQKEVGIHCAEQVATRYEGARCMGTTIHATTPDTPTKTLHNNKKAVLTTP